ncbi:cryptochrome/photolyase family protein [Amorphus orientalis]|uniref:Deoxyribodipyrimidine photo-lyase n=1 Tax=Amorphus orientalis TaxID=649198 RepID=A0AAE3VRE8_9HYPH|nr:deoxyribodipyrimidine photo-lyase [Amorphus orientalis]MDQ0316326.1 deoxyribodipyrimidine photo-lyase [Amorphus orientalis]
MSASPSTRSTIIVWFRDDLRLSDNPALAEAVGTDCPVLPVFIQETRPKTLRPLGGAAKWWLHGSLKKLGRDLEKAGSRLVLLDGDPSELLPRLADEAEAQAVYWNRRYHPKACAADARLKSALKEQGLDVQSFNGSLLVEPWDVQTGEGSFYRVYSPFARAARQILDPGSPLPAPKKINAPKHWPDGCALDDLKLRPTKPDWAGGLRETWAPGEAGARERLAAFLDERLPRYKTHRDSPADEATSALSPHLRFGEISPRTVWSACSARAEDTDDSSLRGSAEKFQSELLWREFAYHLLYHLPPLEEGNVQSKFDDFPWAKTGTALSAWKKGRTGYPIVDAGMRQLWQTGWLHNRVRMIVGSFLTKDLLIDWHVGEDWFWDTLVDADAANNPASWQWVAGSGADAAPYFRVFNPVLQSKKFDPDGTYLRTFLPELAELPDEHIHEPWKAPPDILKAAGVTLGETYPEPVVDHGSARKKALAAYEEIKGQAA